MLRHPARPGLNATWTHVVVALLLSAPTGAWAQDADLGAGETVTSRAEIRRIIDRETARTNLPAEIAEAVVFVESGYNPAVIGSAGELGLMQVRIERAASLGFKGNAAELAEPDINIHYGVLLLSQAWRLTRGDLCRTLAKYRAGRDEEEISPRSQVYCHRTRNRLLATNPALAVTPDAAVAPPATAPTTSARSEKPQVQPKSGQPRLARPGDVYARYIRGTAAASRAYWAAHEARVSRIRARIEARWRRTASR